MLSKNQKVVCINDEFIPGIARFYINLPKKGNIYTVRDVSIGINVMGERGEIAVTLIELKNPPSNIPPYPERAFLEGRFVPLDELTDEMIEHHKLQMTEKVS